MLLGSSKENSQLEATKPNFQTLLLALKLLLYRLAIVAEI